MLAFGQVLADAGRGQGPARLAGAGRQRLVHRPRRRRRRRRGRGRDGGQDAQHGRGLHRGQPLLRPERRGRRVRPQAGREDGRAQGRPRHRGRRPGRPADRRQGAEQGHRPRRGRGRERRQGRHRRHRPGRAGLLLPADGAHRRAGELPAQPRGDLRPGRADHRRRVRGAGPGGGERDRVRPGQLRLHPRPEPGAADLRAAGERHDRAQHRPGVEPGGAVRRGQGVRAGPRGRQRRDRRVPRDQVRGDRLLRVATRYDATGPARSSDRAGPVVCVVLRLRGREPGGRGRCARGRGRLLGHLRGRVRRRAGLGLAVDQQPGEGQAAVEHGHHDQQRDRGPRGPGQAALGGAGGVEPAAVGLHHPGAGAEQDEDQDQDQPGECAPDHCGAPTRTRTALKPFW
ncbi:hypothetical protein L7F22_012825 [Adiantum nelumboides]|nr:hypothetical protein [Adiantum nelumboides]